MTNQSGDEKRTRIQQWCGVLRRAGYRLTSERRAIVAAIVDCDGPFNAPQILARAQTKQPRLGLATVYRTLEALETLGLTQRLHDDQGCHSYLGLGEEFPPFVRCSSCDRLDYVEGAALQALIDTVAAHCNYQIEHYSLQLSGRCEEYQ